MLEKEVKLGDVADFDIKLEGGKASLTFKVSKELPEAALSVKSETTATLDGGLLADKLWALIEEKSPPALMGIEETVKMIVKSALTSL